MTAGMTADDIPWGTKQHTFERLGEGQYRLEIPEVETVFEIDRLHRDRSRDLSGEVQVSCMLAGAKTYRGTLYSGSLNLSDAYRRRDVAGRLKTKASTGTQIDWEAILDELSYRVVEAEREGRPAQLLSSFNPPHPDDVFDIHGIALPKHHPSILFGDGGTFKSYLALYIAGCLSFQGLRVLFADWELEGEDHRGRLERLFGAKMPPVYYQRCLRPMVDEIDGLKRQVAEHRIDYLIADSVGFATDGAPESAEAAMSYFRALRQLRIGSLHLAHVTKQAADAPDPVKPFGSTFWHNSARATWFVKRSDASSGTGFVVALFNKKTNLARERQPVGLQIQFGPVTTEVDPVNIADVEELAGSLPIWQRMKRALAAGPLTLRTLADELCPTDDEAAKAKLMESMDREARRRKLVFTKLTNAPDGIHRIALVSSRTDAA